MAPDADDLTLAQAAERVGVQPATLRRWLDRGLVPEYDGRWSASAIGAARVVARMRERGYSLATIKQATEQGRLAFGFLEDLFGPEPTQSRFAKRRGRPDWTWCWCSGWSPV